MKRSFFFLKDSVTGQFYTGENNWLSDFAGAAVYFTEANAKKKIKAVLNSWEHQQKYADEWLKDKNADKAWAKAEKAGVVSHQDVPNWGIEIVNVSVKAP